MKNFGFSGYDNVIYIGTNGKMNELSAALGLTNLESIDEFTKTNRANFAVYRQYLADIPGLSLMTYDEKDNPNYQYIVCQVDPAKSKLTRDQLVDVLHAENVLARKYFSPGVHRMEPYRSYFPHAKFLLPDTETVAGRVLVLPTGTSVTPSDVETVCAIVRTAIENGDKVSKALATRRT
jgi:dTDP-4-amino-4,6-dideoxygalactose transaminase